MSYIIQFKTSALKELRKLPKEFSKQIASDINALSKNPRPHGHKKLQGNENLYRIWSLELQNYLSNSGQRISCFNYTHRG